jgi:hypothetical protein
VATATVRAAPSQRPGETVDQRGRARHAGQRRHDHTHAPTRERLGYCRNGALVCDAQGRSAGHCVQPTPKRVQRCLTISNGAPTGSGCMRPSPIRRRYARSRTGRQANSPRAHVSVKSGQFQLAPWGCHVRCSFGFAEPLLSTVGCRIRVNNQDGWKLHRGFLGTLTCEHDKTRLGSSVATTTSMSKQQRSGVVN